MASFNGSRQWPLILQIVCMQTSAIHAGGSETSCLVEGSSAFGHWLHVYKELVVGIEIFEGIYSHPGLRTPAECVCGKVTIARVSNRHVHQHRSGQAMKESRLSFLAALGI